MSVSINELDKYTPIENKTDRVHAGNAYVSGMKEDLNIVGNEYQMLTTMWTM